MCSSLGKPNLRKRQLETPFIDEKKKKCRDKSEKKNGFNCIIKQKVKLFIWEGHKTTMSQGVFPEISLFYWPLRFELK